MYVFGGGRGVQRVCVQRVCVQCVCACVHAHNMGARTAYVCVHVYVCVCVHVHMCIRATRTCVCATCARICVRDMCVCVAVSGMPR
jgi:hypothetical protein